jgi:hypothetical protein
MLGSLATKRATIASGSKPSGEQPLGQCGHFGAELAAIPLVQNQCLGALRPRDDFLAVRIALAVGLREGIAVAVGQLCNGRLGSLLDALRRHGASVLGAQRDETAFYRFSRNRPSSRPASGAWSGSAFPAAMRVAMLPRPPGL